MGLARGAGDGRRRVVIEGVRPQVDGGRFPIKRVAGETVAVEADIFVDGHDRIAARLLYRREAEAAWHEVPMRQLGNDRWRTEFRVRDLGRYRYTLVAWVDHFESWRHELGKRDTAEDIALALQVGSALAASAADRAEGEDAERLKSWADELNGPLPLDERRLLGLDEDMARLMDRHADRRLATEYGSELTVVVDPPLAGFGAWYEFFPRSCGSRPDVYGRLAECTARLEYVKEMGFDIVYLPPVHPIGHSRRKGKNNILEAGPDDPGSPWAIGAPEGGHKAVHPSLGTVEEFREFVQTAEGLGLKVALDIAFQTSPDHPYVDEHPEWFRWRPDGTVQYAENPPKKYQDIYPFHFEGEAWESLWEELKDVFDFWIAQGVRVFRVDNPHTKPFPFWEWCIGAIKREHPDIIFLSEAFARPRIMYRLAKLGFTQSYTYFTWRNTKWELTEYMRELTRSEVREYFRPNFWPNTPDILPEYLQLGGRPAFMIRAVLAATLSANYGIYGPAFELLENEPMGPGSEEYLHSEKYQLRQWNLNRPDSLRDFIARLNRIRRDNPAFAATSTLEFYDVDNEEILCFGKRDEHHDNLVIVVVNLDPYHRQSGWVDLPLDALDIESQQPFQVHDLLSGARYLWHGARNYVELDPLASPAHVFRLRRRVRTEHDFEYFL